LSECAFNSSDYEKANNNRRIDFWCLNRDAENGNRINYFIEIKKGWYCLNEKSNDCFQKAVAENVKNLENQTKSIKSLSPQWEGIDDVYLGLSVIHGYYREGKEYYDATNVSDYTHQILDKRSKAHLLTSTWILPEDMKIQWEKDKCRFVSISGIVISKTRNKSGK
jgi:hypothetical protein